MSDLPALSTEEMVEVDRLMIEEYGIKLIQMMENAGRNLALLAKRMLEDELEDRPVVVLAGRGNNGGGALVAARHLLNWGAWVQLLLTHSCEDFEGVPAHQLAILEAMGLPLAWAEEGWELPPADLIIDGLIGYGLNGAPRGSTAELIRLANSSMAPILSLDVPSGLDSSDGHLFDPHVRAEATLALALPKRGLLHERARSAVGRLYLADISVPPDLYARLGYTVPSIFSADTVLALESENGTARILQDD